MAPAPPTLHDRTRRVRASDTHAVTMNQPSRADRFVLPEGERKLTFERDTKVENAGTFVLQREDHTLGNLLRMYVEGMDGFKRCDGR